MSLENRMIIKSSPLPLMAFDSDGKIICWNPAAEKMFGWEKQEVRV